MSLEFYDPSKRKSGNLLEIDDSSDSVSNVTTPQKPKEEVADKRVELIDRQTRHIVEMFSSIAADIKNLQK